MYYWKNIWWWNPNKTWATISWVFQQEVDKGELPELAEMTKNEWIFNVRWNHLLVWCIPDVDKCTDGKMVELKLFLFQE